MADPILREILYCSVLASHQSAAVVGQIVAQARALNTAQGITGLLVFDGVRFCQHLEGPPDTVRHLMRRIAADPRHGEVRVVYEGPRAERRYRRFDLGFAQTEGPEDMAGVEALEGDAALAHFLALRPGFDVNG